MQEEMLVPLELARSQRVYPDRRRNCVRAMLRRTNLDLRPSIESANALPSFGIVFVIHVHSIKRPLAWAIRVDGPDPTLGTTSRACNGSGFRTQSIRHSTRAGNRKERQWPLAAGRPTFFILGNQRTGRLRTGLPYSRKNFLARGRTTACDCSPSISQSPTPQY